MMIKLSKKKSEYLAKLPFTNTSKSLLFTASVLSLQKLIEATTEESLARFEV